MDLTTAIQTRRSVRLYTEDLIEQSLIEKIVENWCYAPSAHNQQARKFFLIAGAEDKAFLGEIMEFWKMLPSAQRVVLAAFDQTLLRDPEFIQQDMGASIQNILLSAHQEGVWAVRCGLYPHESEMEQISTHFQLPSDIVPFALISLGMPAQPLREKHPKRENKIQRLS